MMYPMSNLKWRCLCLVESMASCGVSEEVCGAVAAALTLYSTDSPLRELALSSNDLRDSGVQCLCNALAGTHCALQIMR